MHPLELGVLVPVFQGKYSVGDDPELGSVLSHYTPLKKVPFRQRRKLVFVEDSDAFLFSAGEFKGYHHVGNQKRMFKENPTYGTVFLIPGNRACSNAKLLVQKCPGLVAQTIYNMLTASLVVIVELSAWPFQIPMAVEEFQPPGYLLRAAAKQGDDLMRTKKTMPMDESDDVTIAFRKSHGRVRRSSFEAGTTGCHRARLQEI